MKKEFLVVFCTVPNQKTAEAISTTLVEEKLAACCNIVPGITSIYFWNNEVQKESELLLIIKTSTLAFENLRKRIEELHPYEVPEIIALPIKMGNQSYLSWVDENVKS